MASPSPAAGAPAGQPETKHGDTDQLQRHPGTPGTPIAANTAGGAAGGMSAPLSARRHVDSGQAATPATPTHASPMHGYGTHRRATSHASGSGAGGGVHNPLAPAGLSVPLIAVHRRRRASSMYLPHVPTHIIGVDGDDAGCFPTAVWVAVAFAGIPTALHRPGTRTGSCRRMVAAVWSLLLVGVGFGFSIVGIINVGEASSSQTVLGHGTAGLNLLYAGELTVVVFSTLAYVTGCLALHHMGTQAAKLVVKWSRPSDWRSCCAVLFCGAIVSLATAGPFVGTWQARVSSNAEWGLLWLVCFLRMAQTFASVTMGAWIALMCKCIARSVASSYIGIMEGDAEMWGGDGVRTCMALHRDLHGVCLAVGRQVFSFFATIVCGAIIVLLLLLVSGISAYRADDAAALSARAGALLVIGLQSCITALVSGAPLLGAAAITTAGHTSLASLNDWLDVPADHPLANRAKLELFLRFAERSKVEAQSAGGVVITQFRAWALVALVFTRLLVAFARLL